VDGARQVDGVATSPADAVELPGMAAIITTPHEEISQEIAENEDLLNKLLDQIARGHDAYWGTERKTQAAIDGLRQEIAKLRRWRDALGSSWG